jgi:hypothetical protein
VSLPAPPGQGTEIVVVVLGDDVPRVCTGRGPAVVPVGVGDVVADCLRLRWRRTDGREPAGVVVAVDRFVGVVVAGVVRVVRGELFLDPVELVVVGLLDEVIGHAGGGDAAGVMTLVCLPTWS